MFAFNGSHPASPSVFISSTVQDFRDTRSALAYILRAQGFRVYLSEATDFAVCGDRSAFEECFRNIRECHYYVLLIGGKRGTLLDDGISITRQEYRVAREQFLRLGRPRLFLYVNGSIRSALDATDEEIKAAGIDDVEHLDSFIKEVEQPLTQDVPNYLTRFQSVEELMHSLASRLNLGRNLTERLTRYSLVSELASNLTLMVRRAGNSATPRHSYLSELRRDISIKPEDVDKSVVVTGYQLTLLIFALVGRARGDKLSTRVMQEAIDQGIFLVFNPATDNVEASTLHRTLLQTLDDVEDLCQIDDPLSSPSWDSQLLTAIRAEWRGQRTPLQMGAYHIVRAFAYYDRIEDVFNGHVSLLKTLLGLVKDPSPFQRRPLTPLGERAEKGIRAERVLPEEILLLMQKDIYPFGSRILTTQLGSTREEQIEKLLTINRAILSKAGMAVPLDPDILRSVTESMLDEGLAQPHEGIDNLSSK